MQASEEMALSSRRMSSAAEGQSSRSGISTMRRNGSAAVYVELGEQLARPGVQKIQVRTNGLARRS